jgi:hypothetical protein
MLAMTSINWTDVLVALIAGLPAIIAAVGVILVRKEVKTPNGTSLGAQVEAAVHAAVSNNLHLQAISKQVDAPVSEAAVAEAQLVPKLAGEHGAAIEAGA